MRSRLVRFVLAVLVAAAWGSVVQTQFNLAGLAALGADIPLALRLQTTGFDLLGFGPFFAAIAAVTFLVAFPVAHRLGRHESRTGWFALAGFAGLVVAIKLIDMMVPPPVLIAATRTVAGLIAVALAGAMGGTVFAWRRARPGGPQPSVA